MYERIMTPTTVDELIRLYPETPNLALAKRFGLSINSIFKYASKYRLRKRTNLQYPDVPPGTQVNDVTVLKKTDKKSKNNILYLCKCKCGMTLLVRASLLRKRSVRSCTRCTELRNSGINHHRRGGCGPISGTQWSKMRSHATERGIDFRLSIQDAVVLFEKQSGECALSGLPIHFPTLGKDVTSGTASLDRIDSNGPYASGNVRWVHKDINLMRHKHSDEYFVRLCRAVADHQRAA